MDAVASHLEQHNALGGVPIKTKRRRGSHIIDFSPGSGTLSLPTGGAGTSIALDNTVLIDGRPSVKCTFSTSASDTFVGRFALTDPVSFKDFKNIVIPIKITANDAVGNVGTSTNPFYIWLRLSGTGTARLRLDCSGISPDGVGLYTWTRSESATVVDFGGGIDWSTLDSQTVTQVDFVNLASAGIGNAYPVWVGNIYKDVCGTPIVSLRMDGQYSSQYTRAFPIYSGFNLRSTLAIQRSLIDAAGRLTVPQLRDMVAAQHEIGIHSGDVKNSQGYANATDWPTAAGINDDISSTINYIETTLGQQYTGVLVEGFLGQYAGGSTTLARQRTVKSGIYGSGPQVLCTLNTAHKMHNVCGRFFRSERPNFIRSSLSLGSTSTSASIIGLIDQAIQNREWGIITLHEVISDSATPTGNQIKETAFTQGMEYLAQKVAQGAVLNLPLGEAYNNVYRTDL